MQATSSAPAAPAPRRRSAQANFDHRTEGDVGRASMIGALIGSIALGTTIGLGTMAAFSDVGQGLGVGMAVALTGGPFFGALVGFSRAVHNAEAAASELAAERAPEPAVPLSV